MTSTLLPLQGPDLAQWCTAITNHQCPEGAIPLARQIVLPLLMTVPQRIGLQLTRKWQSGARADRV